MISLHLQWLWNSNSHWKWRENLLSLYRRLKVLKTSQLNGLLWWLLKLWSNEEMRWVYILSTCGWIRRGHLFIIMDGNDFFFVRFVDVEIVYLCLSLFFFLNDGALFRSMTIVRWICWNFLLIVLLEKPPYSNGISHILPCIYYILMRKSSVIHWVSILYLHITFYSNCRSDMNE
jgi:hypothetical protein